MSRKNRIIEIILVASLLCGCASTSAFNANDKLILRQVNSEEEKSLVVETVSETHETGEMPAMVYAEYDGREGIPWVASYVEGKLATVSEEYVITYDSEGNQIAKTPVIGSKVETPAVAPKMQYGGSISVGSEFYPKMVMYGVDCVGCTMFGDGYGGSSAGITLGMHSVRQPNGEMRDGLKYGDYYVVAADPSIPLCSVLTISEHTFSGEGLTPGVPFQAIVLDRGGAIKGSILDLFKGSQANANIQYDRRVHPKVVIERVGGKTGPRTCQL